MTATDKFIEMQLPRWVVEWLKDMLQNNVALFQAYSLSPGQSREAINQNLSKAEAMRQLANGLDRF